MLTAVSKDLDTSKLKAKETVVSKGISNSRVLIVPIYGVIGLPLSYAEEGATTISQIEDFLQKANEDTSVRAILLDIASPGGIVYDTDQIHYLLKRFSRNKRVFAYFRGLAASGGYYIGCAAERIYCDPLTITGSIGVITESYNIEGLLSKIGVSMEVYKSGEYKDIFSPYRPATDEERAMNQAMVDRIYERFVEVVAEGRKKTVESVKEFADGRVFLPQDALLLGMVDRVCYVDEVYEDIRAKIGDNASFVKVSFKKTLFEQMFESRTSDIEKKLSALFALHGRPTHLYLWSR